MIEQYQNELKENQLELDEVEREKIKLEERVEQIWELKNNLLRFADEEGGYQKYGNEIQELECLREDLDRAFKWAEAENEDTRELLDRK